jgi:hypothetical protein
MLKLIFLYFIRSAVGKEEPKLYLQTSTVKLPKKQNETD